MPLFYFFFYPQTLLGTWSTVDSLNLTRIPKDSDGVQAVASPLVNKTFVVTCIETPPYTMLKLDVSLYSI